MSEATFNKSELAKFDGQNGHFFFQEEVPFL